MKKVKFLLILFVLFTFSLRLSAQVQRSNYLGVNPLGLILNIYSGAYEHILEGGEMGVKIPFFYWAPTNDITMVGAGAYLRKYMSGNGKGGFVGFGANILSVSWDYVWYSYDWQGYNLVETSHNENITGIILSPKIELGYRWVFKAPFTIAPSINAGYGIGSIKASDGNSISYGTGLQWGLGLDFAVAF